MAKVCEICDKSTTFGKNIQHHHADKWRFRAPRTSRKWKPNLRSAKVEIDGKVQKVTLCMKCYKTLAKKGKLV
jgi:large subunit ribosomal protein L28